MNNINDNIISKEQITAVKGRGFLQNRGTDCFSGRVVSIAGIFSSDQLKIISECASKFGNGKIIFTSRLSAEIVGISYDKIPDAEKFMAENGLYFGGTGAKIRPITACKGSTCVYGNIDTHFLAKTLHEKFYLGMKDVKLPHKFKIGIGGCQNSCMKQSLNDVGIEGCKEINFTNLNCKQCKKCSVIDNCPVQAITRKDGIVSFDKSKCINCGVCTYKCPFKAFTSTNSLCKIYVGGTWGKTQRNGTLLNNTYSFDEIPLLIEKIILWYKENGYVKERLGATIDRLGIEKLELDLLSNDLIERKLEILNKPLLQK